MHTYIYIQVIRDYETIRQLELGGMWLIQRTTNKSQKPFELDDETRRRSSALLSGIVLPPAEK